MSLLDNVKIPMKPAEFAEHQIIEAILDKSYTHGDALPAERILAQSLGVTRPTLRETLQRLSKEGWVTIAHGKPTRVNDYLSQGGLGILTTLARYKNHLSHDMVDQLLEARTLIFPGLAQRAVEKDSSAILTYLRTLPPVEADAISFARFDWELQVLMVAIAQNSVLKMMFNDFSGVYHLLGERYYRIEKAKTLSLDYYKNLDTAIRGGNSDIRSLVEATMEDVKKLWETMQ